MKKGLLKLIIGVSALMLLLTGCDQSGLGDQFDIPENATSMSVQVSEEELDGVQVLDADGNEVELSSTYNGDTELLNIKVDGLEEGQEYTIKSGDTVKSTVYVKSADRSVPVLSSSNISSGQTGVEVNLPIELNFSKTIDGSSLNYQSVYLYEVKYSRYVPVRYIYQYNKITVIPQMKLQQDLDYILVVNNLKDVTGAAVSASINYKNSDLDYGLYFYGKNGVCEKYFPGVQNAFYDNSKPTMIYAHGWQADAVTKEDVYGRENYGYELFYWAEDNFKGKKEYNGLRQYTNHGWIDKGWNTGFVYWQQFADEPTMSEDNVGGVHDAEAKIWSFFAYKGSRYRVVDANGNAYYKNWNRRVNFGGTVKYVNSVGHLLSLYVNDAIKDNTSNNIRFVGHSLGNQVANNLAKYAFDAGIKVNRIALLDPAWTANEKDYLPNDGYGKWVGERCRNYLFEMMDTYGDVAVEVYHTTGMNIGAVGVVMDPNHPLTNVVTDVNSAPWYYGNTQLDGKHVSIRHTYIWSMSYAAPAEVIISWWRRRPTGKMGPSATTPDWRIREMMGPDYEWTQVEGRYTPSPSDDQFERKTKDTSWFSLW